MERLQPKVGLLCPPIANPARSPRVERMRKPIRSKTSWCTTSNDWEITLPQYKHPILDQRPSRIRKVLQSCSHDAVIRVYDDAGNVIETHEHAGEFKEPSRLRIMH